MKYSRILYAIIATRGKGGKGIVAVASDAQLSKSNGAPILGRCEGAQRGSNLTRAAAHRVWSADLDGTSIKLCLDDDVDQVVRFKTAAQNVHTGVRFHGSWSPEAVGWWNPTESTARHSRAAGGRGGQRGQIGQAPCHHHVTPRGIARRRGAG
jgi:hypothetical protein